MMKWYLGLSTVAFLAAQFAAPSHAGEVEEYLTRDGKLKAAVTFKTGAVSFLAPPGEEWTIEPSGEWTQKFSDTKGKLSARQLAALAQHLTTQDFNTLPKTQGYETVGPDGVKRSGYRYVVIGVGAKETTFHTKVGDSRDDYLPKPGDPKAAAWSRFIALELILAEMLSKSELNER